MCVCVSTNRSFVHRRQIKWHRSEATRKTTGNAHIHCNGICVYTCFHELPTIENLIIILGDYDDVSNYRLSIVCVCMPSHSCPKPVVSKL